MALHRESSMFSFWQNAGGGTGFGLLPIIQSSLGQVVVDHLDVLARNAYFAHPYPMFGNGGASGVSLLDPDSDKASTDLLDEVWLSMRDRKRVAAPLPVSYPTGGEILCITTAGFVHDLKREVKNTGTNGNTLGFVDAHLYGNTMPLITGELGMYRGVRFIDNGLARLWNIGDPAAEGAHQTAITAAVTPGDGAADPDSVLVEGVRRVGQPGATHYIQCDDVGDFEAGEMVTIHVLRSGPSDYADGRSAPNGVLYNDPMLQDVEIHSVDVGNNRIALKEPYMMTQGAGKGLETDLGGGVYGYVTRAQTVHTALFLNPSAGVSPLIAGVAQPPALYTPRPIDDYESMYRVAYDFWLKYGVWEARVFNVWFGTGANAIFNGIFR